MMEESREKNPLSMIYLKNVFRLPILNILLRGCEDIGFANATYVDGKPRENVKTLFIDRKGSVKTKPIFERIDELAAYAGKIFGIGVWPKKLESIQVARYMPGDFYGDHIDHDSSLQNLGYDRKLSFFVGCSPGCSIGVEKEVWNVGVGDAIIFPSTMFHFAPQQKEGSRYSFVAWIPGPNWR